MEEIEKKTKTIIIKIKQDIKTNELCSYISLQCAGPKVWVAQVWF
jgi:hypothetical protein